MYRVYPRHLEVSTFLESLRLGSKRSVPLTPGGFCFLNKFQDDTEVSVENKRSLFVD